MADMMKDILERRRYQRAYYHQTKKYKGHKHIWKKVIYQECEICGQTK